MWALPRPGLKPMSPALAGGFLTTAPPEKSLFPYFKEEVFHCDFFLLFGQSCVAAFLDVVIGGRAVETPPMSSVNLLEGLSRTVVYITYSQLITLVMALFFNRTFSKVIYLNMGRVLDEYIV